MKCLISSAAVSRAVQVDPMSVLYVVQMVKAKPEIMYHVPFPIEKKTEQWTENILFEGQPLTTDVNNPT